jgi:hypothetical protein
LFGECRVNNNPESPRGVDPKLPRWATHFRKVKTMPQVYRVPDYAALCRALGIRIWTEADFRLLGIYRPPPILMSALVAVKGILPHV